MLFSQRGFEATQIWLNCTSAILAERALLIRDLKAGIDHFKTSIVQLAAFKQEDDRRPTEAAGFNHHTVKPTDTDAPMKLLRSLPEVKDGG
jgi:hypothetical protein